jgi:PHD/YefM family antitoxin component YafN of YafNO toxin-antitoxin module
MEYQIGTTNLRHKLTDVLIDGRENGATYVIETFGRPKAAIINLEQYQRMKEEAEVLAWIEQARTEVYEEQMKLKAGQAT